MFHCLEQAGAFGAGGGGGVITLNLLPPGRPARAAPAWLKKLPWKKLGIAAGGLLAVGSAWVLVAAQNQARSLARVRAEWEALQPERIRLEQQQATLRAFRNRESILSGLKAPEGRWASRLNFLSDAVVSDLWFTLLNFSASPKGELEKFLRAEGMEVPDLPMTPGTEQSVDETGSPIELSAGGRPFVLLAGSALVSGKGQEGPPVSRFLQKIKEHPEFGRWFSGMELKGIRHRQVKSEEVSDFVLFFFPTTGS